MAATKILLTAEEFDNYPFEEDKRYELDEGEMIEMSRPAYRHNRVLIRLTARLFTYCENSGIGEVLLSENLYALSFNTRRAPDAAVILGDRSAELANAKVIPIIPELCVEVLSPSESPSMIHRKLKQYFEAGVKANVLQLDLHASIRSTDLSIGEDRWAFVADVFGRPRADHRSSNATASTRSSGWSL